MFSKKPHADVKKSSHKVLDPKKDSVNRLKHLKIVLDNSDVSEAKAFFEANFSHVYFIFYDVFVSLESTLKLRAHKTHREELDSVKYIFEKILLLLPELIRKKWQFRSIHRIMKRFLHHGNSIKLREEGIRLFLLWYQVLGENVPEEVHNMFATLVPGILPGVPNPYMSASSAAASSSASSSSSSASSASSVANLSQGIGPFRTEIHHDSTFYTGPGGAFYQETENGTVCPGETGPLVLAQAGEFPEDTTRYFLERLLEYMVSQVTKIVWRENQKQHHHQCFEYLFGKFKSTYLPHIFPKFCWTSSLYKPTLELPELRTEQDAVIETDRTRFPQRDTLPQCQAVVIQWVANYTHFWKKVETLRSETQIDRKPDRSDASGGDQRKSSSAASGDQSSHSSVQVSNSSFHTGGGSGSSAIDDISEVEYLLVRDTLYATRENVNLVHEVFRQSFLMPFAYASSIRRVVRVYKDWINMHGVDETKKKVPSDIPVFVKEPIEDDVSRGSSKASDTESLKSSDSRDDHSNVRAGLQNMLQVFITNAANIFLLEVPSDKISLLDEQVDICKIILNTYRYMVMNVKMDKRTWEQLLLVLLQITSLVLRGCPPDKKEDTLGGRLAPGLSQTLIVTWIRANLYVYISPDLWNQFHKVMSSLTEWAELVVEWTKILDTLMRIMARHVYGLDLEDLPLDRPTERKQKRYRGIIKGLPPPSKNGTITAASSAAPASGGTASATGGTNSSTTGHSADDGSAGQKGSTGMPLPAVHAAEGGVAADTQDDGVKKSVERLRSTSGSETPRAWSASPCVGRMTMRQRSLSDSCLVCTGVCGHGKRRSQRGDKGGSGSRHKVSDTSSSVDQEICTMLSTGDFSLTRKSSKRVHYASSCNKSKSLDDLLQHHHGMSPCPSESSGGGSRSPSPTPSSGLESTSIKDSPMQLDGIGSTTADGSTNCADTSSMASSSALDRPSVMAGGTVTGWVPEVAAVLWRRLLGALGDINRIRDPNIHASVMEYLVKLSESLIKIRENLGLSMDGNPITPSRPSYIPPLHLITPWLFRATALPEAYHKGKVTAYQLLCMVTVRRHDIPLPHDYLIEFYHTLHHGLVGTQQDVINTIVKYSGRRFFSVGLPGSTCLLLDFIFAADTIISSTQLKDVPRTEAVSLLGSLLCFPNTYGEMPVLQPSSADLTLMTCRDAKDHIVSILLKSGKREPAGLARCVAISSLGIYLYEELQHRTNHSRIREAMNVLLSAVRLPLRKSPKRGINTTRKFNNKSVAQVACDMIFLLCDQAEYLLQQYADIPRKILEVLTTTLSGLLPGTESNSSALSHDDKKLLLSLMFCTAEWCMRIPQDILMAEDRAGKSLLLSVFKVLNSAATGSKTDGMLQPASTLSDLAGPDVDPNIQLDNLQEGTSPSIPSSPSKQAINAAVTTTTSASGGGSTTGGSGASGPSHSASSSSSFLLAATPLYDTQPDKSLVKLTSKTIMTHLINHLGHFPMGVGAARLTSLVNEHDDVPLLTGEEISAEVFHSPNVQFFVVNNCSVVSFIEIPMEEVPGGGPTAGLVTAKSQVRVIVRNQSGKFSWDCSLLFGPPDWCCASSVHEVPPQPPLSAYLPHLPSSNPPSASSSSSSSHRRPPDILPTYENADEDCDNLDDLLRFIGHTSPECVLEPGHPLNAAVPAPSDGVRDREKDVVNVILNQHNEEMDYVRKHATHQRMTAKPLHAPSPSEPQFQFQHCRLLFDQLGFLSWEKRPHIDLLKKNERVLRELRNLDNQKCRETHKIAVFYVAEGQEDKASIVLNTAGSQAYEEFVAGLGWEVDLETHPGFIGGLHRNRSTGDTAPYYATSFLEVIFHVCTRMPNSTEEDAVNKKVRHLGNDEVHIVWSEHTRDYRRGIIPTEFGDVVIIIYPLPNNLFRIHISRKQEVPFFGPLFSGAIIDRKVLPGLVRATAINASRATRSLMCYFENFYEERAKALDKVVQACKEPTTFEQFAASLHTSHPSPASTGSASCTSSNVAALVDAQNSPTLRSRPASLSTMERLSPRTSPQSGSRTPKERPLSASQSHSASSPLSSQQH